VRTFASLCLVAVLVSGCGGGAPRDSAKQFKGEERGVAAAIESLESAARKSDGATICRKLLAPNLLGTLRRQGTSCATAVKEQVKIADSFDLTVDDVTVDGAKATAKVTSGKGSKTSTDTLDLEKVGAAWKIAQLRP
jgi:hypothetical protein